MGEDTANILELLRAGASESMPVYFVRSLFYYWDTVARLVKEGKVSIEQVLAGDAAEASQIIDDEIKDAYKLILSHLETGLADQPELFAKMRPVVLRAANDAGRNIKSALRDFHVLRFAESKTTTIYVEPDPDKPGKARTVIKER